MSENNLNQFDSGQGGGSHGNKGNQSGGQGGPGNGKNPKKQSAILFLIAALVTLLFMSSFMKMIAGETEKEVSYNEFVEMLEAGKVESVEIASDRVLITPVSEKKEPNIIHLLYGGGQTITYYTGRIEDNDTLTQRLLENNVPVKGQVADGSSMIFSFLLTYVVPILLMWVLLSFLFRKMSKGGGPMGVGKSNAKVYVQKETGISFKDVAGEDEAKESLQEVVDFLHNPGKYAKIGAKLP